MRYEDFVIQVTTDREDEVVLRVTDSPAGESAAVDAGATSSLGRLLERCRDPGEGLDCVIFDAGPEGLGGLLFEALIVGPVEQLFLESLGHCRAEEASGLRLKLEVDLKSKALAEVHALPWEFLYRREAGSFLALDRRFAIVRHIRMPVPRRLPVAPRRLRILVAVAMPRDRQRLDTEEESRRIAASWQEGGAVVMRFLANATLDRLRQRLLAEVFDGLHFIGHGEFDDADGDGFLILEDDQRNAAPCSGRDLAIQLSDRTSLRWVFLNACSTGTASTRRPFGGLATALLRTGIPAVLAMQQTISDRAAVAFSQVVYQRLAGGDAIETAVSEGRLAIHRQQPDSLEWGTPVLFLRSRTERLLRQQSPLRPSALQLSTPPTDTAPNVAPTIQKRRYGFWWLVAAVSLAGLALLMRLDFSPEVPSSVRAQQPVVGVPVSKSLKVREGEIVTIPNLGAHLSVSFDGSLGSTFARLTVTLDGKSQAVSKTFMGPTTVELGDKKCLRVQSVDWQQREILVVVINLD